MRAERFGADEGVALDIDEAAFWYELEFGAGKAFLDAVEDTLDRVLARPRQYQTRRADVRLAHVRGRLRRDPTGALGPDREFPYAVYFSVDDDDFVYVWAVASLKREPYYWIDRLNRR